MNDKINEYIELLVKWNKKSNISGYKTAEEIKEKLIGINLQAIDLMDLNGEGADIGSGNGSLGILIKLRYPDKPVWFVERNKRKAAFIQYASHKLGITNYNVIAENLDDSLTAPSWNWAVARRINLSGKLLRILRLKMRKNGKIFWITSPGLAERIKVQPAYGSSNIIMIDEMYDLVEITAK